MRSYFKHYSPNQVTRPPPAKGSTPLEAATPVRSQVRSHGHQNHPTHAFSSLPPAPCWEENPIGAGTCVLHLPCTPRTPRRAQLGNAACILPPPNNPTMASFPLGHLLLKPRNTPLPKTSPLLGEDGVLLLQVRKPRPRSCMKSRSYVFS